MATSRQNATPTWQIVTGLFFAAAGFIFVWATIVVWDTPDEEPSPRSWSYEAPPPDWSLDGATRARVELSESGPTLHHEDTTISIAPSAEKLEEVGWSTSSKDGARGLFATGTWHGQSAAAAWQFADGNPQARLTIQVRDVPLEVLRNRTFSASLTLPSGPVDVLDEDFELTEVGADGAKSYRVPPIRPSWVRWRPGTRSITWHRWSGDGIRVRRTSEGGVRLHFDLWRPDMHPGITDCEIASDDDSPTLDLEASVTMSLGDAPRIFPAAAPASQRGLLIPVFDTPGTHPDTQLQKAKARDARDWANRVETLAYGHSDSADPRYGTGGLLGHGLGGTVVAPASYATSEAMREVLGTLDGTGLDVAIRGDPGEDAPSFQAQFDDTPSCEHLLGGPDDSTKLAVAGPVRSADERSSDALTRSDRDGKPNFPVPNHATAVRPLIDRLDGRRDALVEETFGRQSLEKLVASRGIAVVSTPLVGTRNPLAPAARDALLEPERFGRWTLADELSKALLELELARESLPIGVVSLEETLGHIRTGSRTRINWRDDGSLQIRPPASSPASELTLLAIGETFRRTEIRVDDEPPRHRMPAANGRPETRFSFGITPGETSRVTFEGLDAPPAGLEPVEWELVE